MTALHRLALCLRRVVPLSALALCLAAPVRAADTSSVTTPVGVGSGMSGQPDFGTTESRGRIDGTVITNTQPRGAAGLGLLVPGAGNAASLTEPLRRRPLPPTKPSEFQKFVQQATGRLLPVFGSSFFASSNTMATPGDLYQPQDNIPVSADYTVGAGDEIVVRAWGSIDVDYRAIVDRNGQISLPKIGTFTVTGVKAADLERTLRAQIGRLYTNFDLSVSLGQLHGVKVFVVGPALLPGVFHLDSQATLLSAVVAAGGPGPDGSMRKVSLRRDGKVISELDVYAFLVQGDKSKDVQLVAGDVVVFHPVGPRVALNGDLDNAAIYELKDKEEPLGELLRYAGGAPVLANPNRAVLERIDPSKSPAARYVEDIKLDTAGLRLPLRDGDVVTLLAISPAFANAVTLKGHVAQPLRYAWFPGMRISDLIPSPEALIEPGYYRRRNMLVQVVTDQSASGGSDNQAAAGASGGAGTGALGGQGSQGYQGNQGNQGTQGTQGSQGYQSYRGYQANPGNPGSQGYQANPGNQVNPGNQAYQGSQSAQGNQAYPGSPGYGSDQGQDNEALTMVERVKRSPAASFDDVNWDYAVVERLNRRDLMTEVIPFNLGKVVLQGDQANNIELQPGDVVSIFGQKDFKVPLARQNRLVVIEGEVATPGVYQLVPGETLRQLVTRAGGFTPQAYVYGVEFSREETRKRQRENLAAAIARLQSQSATQAAREAANRTDLGAAGSASLSAATTSAQLTRLSKVEPNGRIALELSPDATSVDALPDLPLENGDRVVVPSRPGSVTVVGAVVNSNAFLWRSGRTAGDYLKIAGPDDAADLSNMFILRADGTVNSSTDNRGWFGHSNLESQAMQPGDALIVPNQLDYETWGRAFVRNAKDWTQILANLGLGVAAINSITK